MKATILLLLGALFVINLFFRVRMMKLFKQVKEHQLRIEFGDLLYGNKFNTLINNTYPEHADLLNKYRQSMMTGLGLIILVVAGLLIFLILKPS